MGMTPRQQLLRVELPLALPVIVGGVRTAMAWTVGMATLSTPVGGASLGNYIFSGLQTRNFNAVLVGCLAAAGLALLLDGLARLLLVGIERCRRWLRIGALTELLLLYLHAAAALLFSATRHAPRRAMLRAPSCLAPRRSPIPRRPRATPLDLCRADQPSSCTLKRSSGSVHTRSTRNPLRSASSRNCPSSYL
ncbi:MAG: ABC transporter permease [Myxococcales bacterium]